MLDHISVDTWVWEGLVFCAGIALMRPSKLTWTFALVVVTAVMALTGYQIGSHDFLRDNMLVVVLLTLVPSATVVAVLFHFRYPYIDRRDRWWGHGARYLANMPVKTDAHPSGANLVDISMTGALLRWSDPTQAPEAGESLTCTLPDGLTLPLRVVRAGKAQSGCRIISLTNAERRSLRNLLRTLQCESDPVSFPGVALLRKIMPSRTNKATS
jgi:hypothetical protein